MILTGYMWNPMEAGEAIVTLAKMLIDGKQITDGMEIPGLGKVAVDTETRVIKVDKMQPINKDTIDKLVALGL